MIQPNFDMIERIIDSSSANLRSDPAAKILSTESISGGCISSAQVVTLKDGRQYFVKSNPDQANMFEPEAAGLVAIAATEAIRVPAVIGHGKSDSGTGFLVLEFIESSPRPKDFFEHFGRSLGQMHLNSTKAHSDGQFGLDHANFIGSTPQENDWSQNWPMFFACHRIGYQLKLANENGLANSEFNRSCEKLIGRLPELLVTPNEPPALIHGDLWSGNFMVGSTGEPVLIDPAVYFASREAEFGMTKLFGGFSSEFYHAYNEAYPLSDGWEERAEIYKLYHLINHLNLFGTSYLSGCLTILRKFS